MSRRTPTENGWKITIFEGPDFEVLYYYLCAKNNTGKITNKDQDRVVRVLSGRLFVAVDGKTPEEVGVHQSVVLPRGAVYELASSGTEDTELIICQGPDYFSKIEKLSLGHTNTIQQAVAPAPAAPSVTRRPVSKAVAQATALSSAKEEVKVRRVAAQKRAPLAGQQVTGINPKPVGAGGFAED